MYAPRGFGLSEVGDVEVFAVGDQLHLFHLTLPNHDVVQHAVSSDGLAWRALPNALRTGDPGECDDDQIWTMSVTKRAGGTLGTGSRYSMLYTALARAEDGQIQRTALATSDDLIHWTKHPGNPVGAADPRWYEADLTAVGRVSWRDPKPVRVGDTYYAAVCAREKDGPLLRRGSVGLLASRDLVAWEARPPLFAPRKWWDLECPQVFAVGGTWYLTAAVMEDRTQRYWTAEEFAGPYSIPADGGVLAPRGHYAGRACRWHDLDLYSCWHKADYDWPGFRNPHGKLVLAPLVLFRRPDGSLGRRSFPGWETYRESPARPSTPAAATLFRQTATGGIWQASAGGGMEVIATAESARDFCLEGELHLDARLGGLAFRLDAEGGGYFVEIQAGSTEVILRKWLPARSPDERPWFRQVELQRGSLPRPIAIGGPLPFRLIVSGAYLECSLDGEVVLATVSAEREEGPSGLWCESGQIRATDVRWSPLRRPQHS